MTTLVLAAVLLAVGGVAETLVRHLRTLSRGVRPSGERPSVSVVVPARDEADTLPLLLRSLHELTTAPMEVVVVDDGSRDSTQSVARAAGAVVLAVSGPPRGWTGKAWACHVGAEAARGDLLLFLDADTVLAPDALDALLGLHAQHGGLVSVQPFHEVVRPYEQLSAYFNVVSVMASATFGPHAGRRPLAFGPCLLTSRDDYERAGGHGAVRAEILDDVRLAAAYQRAGLPVRCLLGGASVRFRMYPGGVRQLAEGWTKNIASGASAAAPGPALAVSAWVSAHHAVAVGLALTGFAVATGQSVLVTSGSLALWAVAWVGVAWQLRGLLGRIGSFRWWVWALFPLPLVAFDVIFARSIVLTLLRRSVRWRGREVPVGVRGSTSQDVGP